MQETWYMMIDDVGVMMFGAPERAFVVSKEVLLPLVVCRLACCVLSRVGAGILCNTVLQNTCHKHAMHVRHDHCAANVVLVG